MTEIRFLNYLFLFFSLLLYGAGSVFAFSKYSYVFIYEHKVNEIRVSKEKNKIKCLEDIIDISFNNDVSPQLEFNGKVVTFKYPFKIDTRMTIKTLERFYDVLLKPDSDIGPVVLIAKPSNKNGYPAKGYEYLTTEGLNDVHINREINRISCDHKDIRVEKIILPKDSGVIKESDGTNAYLRYLGKNDVVVHITASSGKVYSVCLKPADVDTKTLILKDSKASDALIGLYGNRREEIVVELIRSAITDISAFSESKISEKNKKIITIDQIEMTEHAQYQFDSDGIILIVYYLNLIPKVKTKISIDEEYLYNRYFKNLDRSNNTIMGLGLDADYLYPDKKSSLFVVLRSYHSDE